MQKDKDLLSASSSESFDEAKHPRDSDGKFISISEFRYLERHADPKQHPAHLYARKNDDVKYIQLTHSGQINGKEFKNIELNKNPNPDDNTKSYFVPESKAAKNKDFRKIKKNWVLSEEDAEQMKPYRDKPFDK